MFTPKIDKELDREARELIQLHTGLMICINTTNVHNLPTVRVGRMFIKDDYFKVSPELDKLYSQISDLFNKIHGYLGSNEKEKISESIKQIHAELLAIQDRFFLDTVETKIDLQTIHSLELERFFYLARLHTLDNFSHMLGDDVDVDEEKEIAGVKLSKVVDKLNELHNKGKL